MLHHLRTPSRDPRRTLPPAGASGAVVIRRAGDADLPALRDLAALDCAAPLAGPALIALVDGRPWAACGLDDDRVVADPFHPTAAAVALLRLRVAQLRRAGPPLGRALPRWISRRVRA